VFIAFKLISGNDPARFHGIIDSIHPKTLVFGFKRSALSIQQSAKVT